MKRFFLFFIAVQVYSAHAISQESWNQLGGQLQTLKTNVNALGSDYVQARTFLIQEIIQKKLGYADYKGEGETMSSIISKIPQGIDSYAERYVEYLDQQKNK